MSSDFKTFSLALIILNAPSLIDNEKNPINSYSLSSIIDDRF